MTMAAAKAEEEGIWNLSEGDPSIKGCSQKCVERRQALIRSLACALSCMCILYLPKSGLEARARGISVLFVDRT